MRQPLQTLFRLRSCSARAEAYAAAIDKQFIIAYPKQQNNTVSVKCLSDAAKGFRLSSFKHKNLIFKKIFYAVRFL